MTNMAQGRGLIKIRELGGINSVKTSEWEVVDSDGMRVLARNRRENFGVSDIKEMLETLGFEVLTIGRGV